MRRGIDGLMDARLGDPVNELDSGDDEMMGLSVCVGPWSCNVNATTKSATLRLSDAEYACTATVSWEVYTCAPDAV